jgi:hypothetical protein
VIELSFYEAYTLYYGGFALYEPTATEVGYDENGIELPF